MIVAATGHRPTKLTKGGLFKPYSDEQFKALTELAKTWLRENDPDQAISGMALGWDQAIAQAATELLIPWWAAVPFHGQESKWPKASQKYYQSLILGAEKMFTITDGAYAPWKMQVRNEWMVNTCDTLLALWDGSSGGTANCIKYAKTQSRVTIINLWDEWSKV